LFGTLAGSLFYFAASIGDEKAAAAAEGEASVAVK
jgi:hypothetical protein